jgi:hypothetical protein
MLISLKDDRKVTFPVCLSVDKMPDRYHFLHAFQLKKRRGGQVRQRGLITCVLTSQQTDPFHVSLLGEKMPDRCRFLSAQRKWHDGRQVPYSYLLTGRHDVRQVPFSCLLTSWKAAGQVPFCICLYSWKDNGKVVYPVCLPVDVMPNRFYFPVCLLVDIMPDRSYFPVYLPVDKMAEIPFSCLLTNWQGGGKVPFPAAYQLTRWRTGPISAWIVCSIEKHASLSVTSNLKHLKTSFIYHSEKKSLIISDNTSKETASRELKLSAYRKLEP